MSRVARVLAVSAVVAAAHAPSTGVAAHVEPPDAVTVVIRDGAFTPATVTVAAGGTVSWLHQDAERLHTVTADEGDFDSHPTCGTLLPTAANCMSYGDVFDQAFDDAGTVSYRSKVHPEARGTVVVAASPTTTTEPDAETTTTEPPTTTTTAPSVAESDESARPERPRDPEEPSSDVHVPLEDDGPPGGTEQADAGGDVDVAGASGLVLFLIATAGGGVALLWRYRPSQWDGMRRRDRPGAERDLA